MQFSDSNYHPVLLSVTQADYAGCAIYMYI